MNPSSFSDYTSDIVNYIRWEWEYTQEPSPKIRSLKMLCANPGCLMDVLVKSDSGSINVTCPRCNRPWINTGISSEDDLVKNVRAKIEGEIRSGRWKDAKERVAKGRDASI